MFAYCRNNPVCRVDVSGAADADCFNDDGEIFSGDDLSKNGGGSSFDPLQYILDNTYAARSGNPSGGKGFSSFGQLKSHTGSLGEGNQWHHVVEQSQISKSGFSSESVNNTSNIIAIDTTTHAKVSGFYSSKTDFTNGLTVRNWLAGQSFETQYRYGVNVLARIMFGGE